MSDTPKTDAFEALVDRPINWWDFARQLERENAALRNEIVRLNGQTNWVCKCGGTDCEGQKENAALRADIHAHEQINRQLIKDKQRLDSKMILLTVNGQRVQHIGVDLRAAIDAARKEIHP